MIFRVVPFISQEPHCIMQTKIPVEAIIMADHTVEDHTVADHTVAVHHPLPAPPTTAMKRYVAGAMAQVVVNIAEARAG